ncbi:MAG: phage tail tape measure protein [Myxococcales bacterium]|nr:phage tail tape measure protein [Myxococcales bacterium]
MSLNNLGLGFVFTARDLASGAIQNLERNFLSLDKHVGLGTERIESAFQQLGVGLAVFSAGAGVVAGAFALANAAGRFEQSIAAVGAISGASAVELGQLRDAAIDAGIATQFSPTEAVLGLRELAQAGFNATESMGLLTPVLDLAGGSLGELSPQQAAGLAAQAMKAFGLSVDQASVSVDRMLQAVNVFALNASELPMALGVASRGAQALHQSLSETLITLGLVKNVIPGVERASTAAAVAMERMADPEVQKKLRGIGVSVVDAHGSFRGFLDVVGDMGPRLERMTEAQRSAFLLSAFGREALGGLSAVMTQVTNGIRTNTGETLRGAAAIAYLRQQFDTAGGTAARFRDQMLNTFEGQKKLLGGSMETLAIVLGEPFAQVLKPIVSAVVEVVNGLLGVLRQLPAPVKRAFAGFVVASGAVITTVGAVIAVKAGIALLAIGLKVLGITAAGLVSTMLPAIAAVAVLGLVIAGLVYAVRNNLGGLGDFVQRVWAKVTLGFQALVQLFEQGGFSGAVMAELDRAENSGLKRFLISVYQVAFRVGRAWDGLVAGFTSALEEAWPVFQMLGATLEELGAAVLELFRAITGQAAGLPSDEYRGFGELVGAALAGIVKWTAAAISVTASFFTSLAKGATVVVQVFSAVFNHLYDSFVTVRSFLTALAESIRSAFVSLSDGVIGLLRRVPTRLLPAEYQWLARQPLSTESQQQLTVAMPASMPTPDVASSSMPARSEAVSRTAELAQLQATFSSAPAASTLSQPITVNVQVDGETIARASHNAERVSAGRSFSSVPSY